MLDDKKKKHSLVDDVISSLNKSTTPIQQEEQNSLLPKKDDILSKLHEIDLKRKEELDKLPAGTKVTFDNNTLGYELPITPPKENTNPLSHIKWGEEEYTRGPYGDMPRVLKDSGLSPKKVIEKERKLEKAKDIRDIGKNSKLWNSISQGVYGAFKTNVEMNTGLDVKDLLNPYKMSYEELNGLLNDGYITPQEFSDYVANRNQLPLLSAITSSLGNSILLAAEIGYTAPKAAVEFTAKGLKFLSKEGLKRWGKEVVTQGINSYRVMGAGSNIRAGREGIAEIKEKNITDIDDMVITLGKHVLKQNVQAFTEGATEGLLRELKYLDVPVKGLLFGSKKAWMNLATNASKKSISGLLLETSTEQVSDLVSDITSGNNVLTEGSNALNILLGNSDQVKREALENLFIEAVTGFALGTMMGSKDLVRRSVTDKLQDKIEKGEITPEEASIILEKAQDLAVTAKAIEKITAKNKRANWSAISKDIGHGLDVFKNFGIKDNPGIVVPDEIKEIHEAALNSIDESLPYNLATVERRTESIIKETGIIPNTLDQSIMLGQENTLTYLNTRGQAENTELAEPFQNEDSAYNMPFELMHSITEDAITNVMVSSSIKNVGQSFKMPEGLTSEQESNLKKDLVIATVLGYENRGLELIKAKWGKILDEQTVNNLVDTIEVQQTPGNLAMGKAALSEAMEKNTKKIDEYYGARAFEEMDRQRKNIDTEAEEIESIGQSVVDVLNQEAKWKPYAVAVKMPDGRVIGGLPGQYHFNLYEFVNQEFENQGVDMNSPEYMQLIGQVEDGFIDFDGTFYNRSETALKSGMEGESISQGVAKLDNLSPFDAEARRAVDDANFEMGLEEDDKLADQNTLNQMPEGKTQRPVNSNTLFPSYGDTIQEFKGKTVAELFTFLNDKGLIQEALIPVYKLILKHAGDISVVFEERLDDKGRQIPGGFYPAWEGNPAKVTINPNTSAYSPFDTANTLLHETLHAFTVDFLRSNTKEAMEFRSDIDAVIKDLLDVLNNPQKAINRGTWIGDPNHLKIAIERYRNHILYYTQNAEEFIAGVFSDTTKVRGILMRIKVTAQRPTAKVTLWDKVRNAFKTAWGQVLETSDSTLFDALIDNMSKHQANLEAFHRTRRKDTELTLQEAKKIKEMLSSFHSGERGFYPENEAKELETERNQEDDDSIEDQITDAATTRGLVSMLASLEGIAPQDMRAKIKEMGSREAFASYLEQLNTKFKQIIDKRIDELFGTVYGKKQENKSRFKDRFITGTFNTIINSKSMPHIMVRTDRNWDASERKQVQTNTIIKLGDTFRNGDGSTADSFVGEVVLEGFIPRLAQILGLSPDSFQLQYIASFEAYKDGSFEQRSTLDRLTSWLLGNKDYKGPKSKQLAEILYANGYIYLGNFGGRNTSPVFFVPEHKRTEVERALTALAEQYGTTFPTNASYGQALRLLLEDVWFGTQANQISEVKDNSLVLKENINKVWKRGMKFLTKINRTWQNIERISEILQNKPLHGISVKNGQVVVRSAVFNSNDNGTLTFRAGGETITVPMSSLLKNTAGTERTDGASFYLLGELDEIYHEIHGTVKDGTIKNVYASKVGEKSAYIKHAMHGVHPSSELGKFMRKHNIGLLISDTSAKISPVEPITISEFNAEGGFLGQAGTIPVQNIMELNLGDFQRIKEELGTNTLGGTIKQWLNGSGHGSYSSVIAAADKDGKYDRHLVNLAMTMTQRAVERIKEQSSPKELLQTLRGIVERPNGPREEVISETFKNVARLTDEAFFDNFGHIFNFPMISEALRQRLFSTLSQSLQGRVPGMRLTIKPDPGYLNSPAGFDLISSSENLDKMLIATAEEDGIMSELYPEANLGTLVKEYLETQRLISIYNEDKRYDLVKHYTEERERVLDKIMEIGEDENTTLERKKVFAKSGGNIYRLIDKTNPKLENLKNKKLKEIVNLENGTLTEDWSVVPEDFAEKRGLKVGDKFIANVTPTDSPLGIIAGRVAAIAPSYKGDRPGRKVMDRMGIIMNSEYIQTIVGKDFDIDTISIVTYHPDYWTRAQYDAVWSTIKDARNKFVEKVKNTTNAVLETKDLTKDDVFTGPVREQYMQAVMGKADAQGFDAIERFWELNDAYLVDPSKIITERLYHTALSALRMKSRVFGRVLNVSHPRWFRTHLAHLIDTNFSVDFPGQLSKLTYIGPDYKPAEGSPSYAQRMAELTWGEKLSKSETATINKITRFLFSTAFDLAAGRDLELQEKPDYYRLTRQIEKQQNILRLLNDGSMDAKASLLSAFTELLQNELDVVEKTYGREHKSYLAAQKAFYESLDIAKEFFNNLETGDVANYPLFTSILSIDTTQLPMPGTSYYDWLIDQNLIAQDLLRANAKLSNIFDAQILAEAGTFKKSDFTQEKNFLYSRAWDIIKFTGTKIKGGSDAIATLDNIIESADETAKMYERTSATHRSKLDVMLQEYAAMRSFVGKPYPVDAIRNGQNWDITHQSIALSLIPKQLDFTATRNKLDFNNNLEGVRAEIISLLHGFEEVISTKTKSFASDALTSYWHGRSVAFPKLLKLVMNKPKVTSKGPWSANFTLGDKKIRLHINIHHQMIFEYNGKAYDHQQVMRASEGDAAELRQLLTERDGLFEGIKPDSEQLNNRAELSKIINFSDNTKPEERVELLEEHIRERLYSPKSIFSNTDRQGLWISFIAQATDLALRDNKLFGLNIRRDAFNDQDSLNYRSNELLYKLLSRFEPQLFNRSLMSYGEITERNQRINKEIGIRATRLSSTAVPEVLNQEVPDESDARTRNNITFDLVREELNEIDQDPSYKELKKVLKEEGYQGGLRYLREMINNTQIKHALASSDLWYGDLVRDIKRSSPAQLIRKYGPDGAEKIHRIIANQALNIQDTERFLQERVTDEGADIAAIKGVFFQLKALHKLSNKVNDSLAGKWKQLLYNKLSYNLVAPMKEKKVHAFKTKGAVIGHIFRYDGVEDLTVQDMESFGKSYSTTVYEGVGESSIAIRKSQELNMTLNRYHTELAGEISSMDNTINLILDQEKRDDFATDNANIENVPRIDLLRKLLPQIDTQDISLLTLRKEIFLLAEDLAGRTGIEATYDERGRSLYRKGDIISYNKYEFIDSLTDITDPLQKLKILAALDIRELYDVKVPQVINKALKYIDRSRQDLINRGDTETIIELDAIRERYLEYLNAIVRKAGKYMPHMFATDTYKFLWANQYRDYIVKKLKDQYPNMDYESKEFGELVLKAIDSAYSQVMVGEATNYTIPNFLPRKNPKDDSYKKATLDMHFQYVGQLITGLKQDLLYVDWLTYKHKSRLNGERTSVMELTKMWYADQMKNKMLHNKDVEVDDIKPGMQINFIKKGFTYMSDTMAPYEGELQVWGVVDKVNKRDGTITLKVDRERIRFETQNDLSNARMYLSNIGPTKAAEPASQKQLFHIKAMVKKGFLTEQEVGPDLLAINRKRALELNVIALERVLANINTLGVYKIDEIYSKDIRGANVTRVKRYTRRGSLEYLAAKKREADNLRNTIGEFDDSIDRVSYGLWTAATFAGNLISTVPKTLLALATMGMAGGINALTTNWWGALLANHTDAPYTNFWKYRRAGKKQWKGFQGKHRDSMSNSQRQWYDLFTSLGLSSNKDLVAISLEAGNLSSLDVLNDKGFLGGISYLYAAIKSGAEFDSYHKKMDEYRKEYLLADNENRRMTIRNYMAKETEAWKAKVEGRIKSYVKETTPTEEEIQAQMSSNRGIDKATATKYARAIKLQAISERRDQEIQNEREAGTFKETTNVAVEEQMDRRKSVKTLGEFLGKHLLTGYLGLGLQALAEVQRRPAFYIGWRTAKDLGYSDDEAIQYGVSSVEYRHAFYGPGYRQFDANTKLGAFLQQYVQYTWNNFTKWIYNFRQALPQLLKQYERQSDKTFITKVWNLMFKRTFKNLDAQGRVQLSRNPDKRNSPLEDVNILHRLLSKFMINMMINQAGSRIFYGLTNFTDPMVQLYYKFMDVFTDKIHPNNTEDDDDLLETLALIGEAFFFLGLPYKLAMQYLLKQPDDEIADVYWRGRIEDQTELIERGSNEIRIILGTLDENIAKRTGQKRFADWNWIVDDLTLGVKVMGFAYPDSPQESYIKWGLYPSLDSSFPFLHLEREARKIRIKNKARYVDTDGRGINFSDRLIHRNIIEAHKTWLPYFDKLSSDYKPTK